MACTWENVTDKRGTHSTGMSLLVYHYANVRGYGLECNSRGHPCLYCLNVLCFGEFDDAFWSFV